MGRIKGTGPQLSAVPSPGDSFKGYDATEAYDPSSYYVRSIDPNVKGDSMWRRTRFPSDVAAEADRLLTSGALAGTPITSFSALLRDALVHRLHYIAESIDDPQLNEFLANERRLARIDSLVRDRETKRKIVDGAQAALEGAIQAQDKHNVRELLSLYEPMIDGLREPYHEQLERACKRARAWLR